MAPASLGDLIKRAQSASASTAASLLPELSAAAHRHPSSVRVFIALAIAQERAGRPFEARQSLARARELVIDPKLRGADPQRFEQLEVEIDKRLESLQPPETLSTQTHSEHGRFATTASTSTARSASPSPGNGRNATSSLSNTAPVRRLIAHREAARLHDTIETDLIFGSEPGLPYVLIRGQRHFVRPEHLAGPIVPTLVAIDSEFHVRVRVQLQATRLRSQGVRLHEPVAGKVESFLLHYPDGSLSVLIGTAIIPLQSFGMSTPAFGPAVSALVAQWAAGSSDWSDVVLEPNLESDGRVNGWFHFKKDLKDPSKRRYSIRTTGGAWVEWAYLNFDAKRFLPLVKGEPVTAHLVPTVFGPTAIDIRRRVDSGETGVVRATVSDRKGGRRCVLLLGDITVPATLPGLAPPVGEPVDVEVILGADRDGTLTPSWQVDCADFEPGKSRQAPPRADHRTADWLSGVEAHLEGESVELLFPKRMFNTEQELRFFKTVRDFAATTRDRSESVSRVVGEWLRAGGDARESRQWMSRYGLVFTHILGGTPVHRGSAPVTASDGELSEEDPVYRELANRTVDTDASASLSNFFIHGFGPSIWSVSVALGDLGYRLRALTLRRGFSVLKLSRPVRSASEEFPRQLRLILIYGWTDSTAGRLMDVFGTKYSEPTAQLMLLCPALAPTRHLETEEYLLIPRSDCRAIALRYGVAFGVADAELTTQLLTDLVLEAKLSSTLIINPISTFPSEARHLMPVQFVDRPAVVASLKQTLDTAAGPVAIYCMRKAGKTATARLLAGAFGYGGQVGIQSLGRFAYDCKGDSTEFDRRVKELLRPDTPTKLLVLDEFDSFCRSLMTLGMDPMPFLYELEAASRTLSILVLGFDPEAFPHLKPEMNPIQVLEKWRLPYFSDVEAIAFLKKIAGVLHVETATALHIHALAGGHPVVMKELLASAADSQFGSQYQGRIPRGAEIKMSDEWQARVNAPAGHEVRTRALQRLVESRVSDVSNIAECWQLIAAIACRLRPVTSLEELSLMAANSRLKFKRSIPQLAIQLMDWGLLRDEKDELHFGIPLLRTWLRVENADTVA